MNTGAAFSPCRQYRYALWRIWEPAKPTVMFIGLNPSVADETDNDPTINRCIGFAKSWKLYGGIIMANAFAYCSTDPGVMQAAADPVGPENDDWLHTLVPDAGLVVAAWGNHGAFTGRSTTLRDNFANLYCLKLNRTGEPRHPLYVPASMTPQPLL